MEHPDSDIFQLGDQYSEDYEYLEFSSKASDLLVTTDPEASFLAEFHSGYIFRMLIEYIRDTNTNGNFIITEEGITYTQADGPERLLNDVVIYAYELTKFEFQSKTGRIIVGVNANDLRNKAKSIRKKFCVTLYKESGQDFLCMQIHGQTNSGSSGNIIMIKQEHVPLIEPDLPRYQNLETKPNCTIAADLFAEYCSLMKDAAVGKVTISGYPNGMVMLGTTEDGRIGQISDFGILPEKKEEENGIPANLDISKMSITKAAVTPRFIVEEDIPIASEAIHSVTVDVATIKALARLNSITPGGTVKVYFERKTPVKLICHIGTFGKLVVILMGIDPD